MLKTVPWSILAFDDAVRAPAWGYDCGHQLHRHVSCGAYLAYIDIPFLIVNSNDEYIVKTEDVPRVDLMANPQCLYVETEYGGHCDFYS